MLFSFSAYLDELVVLDELQNKLRTERVSTNWACFREQKMSNTLEW